MRFAASWLVPVGLVVATSLSPSAWSLDPASAPEGEDAAPVLVRAKKVVLRPGKVIEDVGVLVRDGIIVAIGPGLEVPDSATVIEGEVVCAGFVDPWSALGLAGATLSDGNTDAATRAVDGVDPYDQDHLRREALRAGVTSVRLQAGVPAQVRGLGALMRLDAERPLDEALIIDDAGLGAGIGLTTGGRQQTFEQGPDGSFTVTFGRARPMDPFDRIGQVDRLVASIEKGRKYREDQLEYETELAEWEKAIAEKEAELEKDFKKAKKDREKEIEKAEEKGKEHKEKKYKEDRKPRKPKFDATDEVFARVADGEIPLVVEVHRAAEIRNLLAGTRQFGRLRLILAGASEAARYAEELSERSIPVIVWPALMGDDVADEHADHDLGLAAELADAGVSVLLGSGGRDGSSTRDLPLLGALAVGHGLGRDKALEALTIGAARAFDVDGRIGSVEVGKEADLLVLDGEPLVSTTRVRFVICDGRVVVTPED